MKLDPERMLTARSDFAQPQVSVASDFSNGECRTIERTSYNASGTATALAQDQITECIALPPAQCL
jgi:hypothetical protein